MDIVNAVVLILACTNAGYVLRLFQDANGHRPFLVGYLSTAVILVIGSLTEEIREPIYTLPALRVSLVVTLAMTLAWAGRKR